MGIDSNKHFKIDLTSSIFLFPAKEQREGKLSSTLMNEYNPFIEHHIYNAERDITTKQETFFRKVARFHCCFSMQTFGA